jgi:hypothetical protein
MLRMKSGGTTQQNNDLAALIGYLTKKYKYNLSTSRNFNNLNAR